MEYNCGQKNYTITPNREDATVRIARRSYPSMASTIVDNFSVETITALSKQINKEMDLVCSTKSDTIFNKDCNKVDFSWDRIWQEIEMYLPTMLALLVSIMDKKTNKPLVCMIVSMVLKHRFHKLSLVQEVISVLLYGNSAHKQVNIKLSMFTLCIVVLQIFKCLQPMMICLSHKGTLNLLDRMNEKFDSLPKSWKASLVHRIHVRVV